MATSLNQKIVAEIGDLLQHLKLFGFDIIGASYSAENFGNFFVDLSRGQESFRIVRDRGQFFIEAERAELERFDLWCAFDDKAEFARRLFAWLKLKNEHSTNANLL